MIIYKTPHPIYSDNVATFNTLLRLMEIHFENTADHSSEPPLPPFNCLLVLKNLKRGSKYGPQAGLLKQEVGEVGGWGAGTFTI